MITAAALKRSVKVAVLTAAFAASGPGIALAGTHVTSGNDSILGGNQINAPISVPVNICGNAVAALLGSSLAGCQGGASVSGGSGEGTWITSGNDSLGGGNQINAPISVPVNVCGNSVAVLGSAVSGCKGGASVSGGSGEGTWITSGNDSIGGGNQVSVPIDVPVNVCGNSVAVLGTAVSHCKGGSSTGTPPPPCKCHHHRPPPPCKCRHHEPPPCHHHHHHHEGPPPAHHHHHHGGTGGMTTAFTGSGTLPTTGANFLGLLALAGSVTVAGAGSLTLLARRGLAHGMLIAARRATRVFAAAR